MAKLRPLPQKLLRVSRWKLKHKIHATVLLCAALVMLTALFGMRSISQAYNHVTYGALADSLSFSSGDMAYRLDGVGALARSISESGAVQANLARLKDSARPSASDYNQVYYALQTFYAANRRNHVINISVRTGRYAFSANASKTAELPEGVYETLRERALEGEGGIRLVTDFSQERGLFFVKEIRRIDNLRLDTLGILAIQVDLAGLAASSGALSRYGGLSHVLIDAATGTVMHDPGQLARGGGRDILEAIPAWQIVRLDGRRYFAASDAIAAYGWKNICLVPYDAIFSSIGRAALLVAAVFAAGLGATFFAGRALASGITRHLSALTRRMDDFAKYAPNMPPNMPLESALAPDAGESAGAPNAAGERTGALDTRKSAGTLNIGEGTRKGAGALNIGEGARKGAGALDIGESALAPDTDDEIRRIYRHFDSMAREIGELITRDYTNQILMKDAQLKALRMQINPHFLYNTLSTVNWKARMIGADDISVMVQSLSRLLQATLREDAGLIPLAEALGLVNTYMAIQKFRFEERLAYTQIVPEALQDALVPKLVLQPIVENAITYGMERAVGACQIFLAARRGGDCIIITVQNDGSCFEDDLLAKLRSGAVAPKGHGTGLANIEKRLELAFGSQAGLRLYNLGDMATAEIRAPYRVS